MSSGTLHDARAALVRDRVLDGVARILAGGDDLTFAKVAEAAGVPERTVYRHFPSRPALMAAVFEWANRRVGFEGERAEQADDLAVVVRRTFPGFDEIAPVVHELLVTPEGRAARHAHNPDRRRATTTLVHHEAPGLDRTTRRRVAAAVQLLTTASTWQTLRDVWEMDGAEAAETAVLAIDLILEGARARSKES